MKPCLIDGSYLSEMLLVGQGEVKRHKSLTEVQCLTQIVGLLLLIYFNPFFNVISSLDRLFNEGEGIYL